jgi:hypothetical protein
VAPSKEGLRTFLVQKKVIVLNRIGDNVRSRITTIPHGRRVL